MTIFRPPGVDQQPEVSIMCWRVYAIADPPTRHFVGNVGGARGGRVSSPIQSYDQATRTGITRSGRRYELIGASGFNNDADYTWEQWKHVNRVENAVDVSKEYE